MKIPLVVLLVAFVAVVPFALAAPALPTAHAGAYVGQGTSYQSSWGYCGASGPTVTELREAPDGSWAFDTAMAFTPLGCGSDGTGVGTFTSQNGKTLYGTPETGLAGSGSYGAFYPAGYSITVHWDLHVGAVGPGTNWSLHEHVDDPMFGPYEAYWNATIDFVGAHA